ncbi:cobaltochelatase subunit CobN [Aequorivita echinoideorum]|uniref:Cobaltochelatase subunit CobN n=1 Tax=Aequorivita echinoideorum TaxID=1549647 RepID=A0ABS5S1F0_9FLAO|nr:cobaltochelatase subunit CobN [Aequorivita echinoideorum]MBT0607039.1 cobaltochelatase subunit CobN [Aequorivita echinoideorum]
MRTPSEIFKNDAELLQNNSVKELISEYENVCDELIDLQQVNDMGKEKYLRILLREIRESIAMELKRDLEAERFKETERVDFKNAVENLRNYIDRYCDDYQIYL